MNLILSHRQTLAALLTAHRDATAALLAAVRSGHERVSKGKLLSDEIDTTTYRKTHSEVLDYIRHQYRPTVERVHQAIWDAITENDADKYVRYALAEVRDDSTVGLRLADADTVAASVFVWCQRSGLDYRPHFAANVLQRIGSDVYRVVDVGDDEMTAWAQSEVHDVGRAYRTRRIDWDEYHAAMVRYQPYIDQNIVPVQAQASAAYHKPLERLPRQTLRGMRAAMSR